MVSDFDPTGILPDDLLERIRERAAAHDRDNTFPDAGPRRADRRRVPVDPRSARTRRCRALARGRVRPAAAPGRRRPRHRARDQHAPRVDGRREGARRPRHRRPALRAGGRGGGRGLRVRHQRGRATIWSCSAATRMPRPRPTARTRSRARRSSRRSPRSGHSWACTASTPPRPTARRWSTRSCRARRRPSATSPSRTTGTRSACAARSRARPSCTARSRPPTASCGASPPGPNPDPIVFGIFSVFEILLGSVYTGIARRALDLAVETARHPALEEDRR